MTNKTRRQRWLASLTRLVHGDGRRAAGRRRVVFRLEELESRLVPSATVQFSTGAETVNQSAGTFSVPVTLTGAPTPVVTTFATGFNSPVSSAFDAAGNLYVANFNNNTVSKVTPAGVVSPFATGFVAPVGLAFDAAGNLYVSNVGDDTVNKVTPTGTVSVFVAGFDGPHGLAFDAAGNLYVSNLGDNTVSKVTPAGVISPFASGFNSPEALAFDAAGNLYVSNFGDNTVSKVTPAGVVSPFASGFNSPFGLAFDAAGNLYVSNEIAAGTVSKVTPAGVVSPFASGFNDPEGLAFDAAGNLYVTNNVGNTVSEVSSTVTVPFTLGGTAVSGTDYSGVTASPLVFTSGQTTEDITGTLLPDPGTIRTLTFALGAPTDAALGSPDVNILTIDDSNPAPTLTSISPASAAVGTPDVIITLTGTNFVSNSTADFNGAPLVTNFISATQLTALIPGSDLATAGTDAILVVTPGAGGGFSAPQTFTVNIAVPAPILTSISPTTATVGDPDTTITLTGANFVNGSTADFNGAPIATTFVSANQLTAVVPAADLTTAGADSVTVVTAGPGGGTSAAQTLTVNAAATSPTPATPLTADQRFLSHVYLDLLRRPIDAAGLATWGAMLDAGVSRTNVVLAIENDPGHEFLHVEVNDAFLQYLKRDADAGGLASFTNFLAGGGTVEQMDALIASSPEYQADTASRGGFNNAFYEDTLGRPLGAPTDPPVSPSLTPDQIAAVFTSPEYYQHLASDYYLRFLDRSFGPADATRAGTPDGVEITEIMGDPGGEYFNKTTP